MKLVKENINSFVRNQNPLKSLSLGYEAKIRNFFRQYNVPDEDYEVKEDGEIVFTSDCNLTYSGISELPDNLTINGSLNIAVSNIIKLPNNLIIHNNLDLRYTDITQLPNNLKVKRIILVHIDQKELINYIQQSKFKNKLTVWNY